MPGQDFNTKLSCPLFFSSPPPPPKKYTETHFYSVFAQNPGVVLRGFFCHFSGCCIVVVLVVANHENSKKHISNEKQNEPKQERTTKQ